MSKRDKELGALFEGLGWTLARAKKHRVWRCPCGEHQVVTSKSASDGRAKKNAARDLKRTGCPTVKELR